ncbi:MAG: hypothetical protein HZY79_00575 [Rhodoblastus sp.]|nr:MAG: hypothetical protein HZY79_00575 [Rhodoblastus sp.]
MRAQFALLFAALFISASNAGHVPTDETEGEITARLATARSAKSAQAVLGAMGSWTDLEKHLRSLSLLKAPPEPWTDALRRLQAGFVWKNKTLKGSREYIVNLASPAGGSLQMIYRGTPPKVTSASQAEPWVDAAFTYNGASEAALIDMTRWCRRGGDYRMPRNCELLRAAAHERGVWGKTAN